MFSKKSVVALILVLVLSFSALSALAETKTTPQYKTYPKLDWKGVSRNPDKYTGQTVQFTGYILQVIENEYTSKEVNGYTHMSFNNYGVRVATKGKYDDVVYLIIPYDAVEGGGRLLEDDRITVYGKYSGLKTYKTIMGGSVTLPLIDGEYLVIDE